MQLDVAVASQRAGDGSGLRGLRSQRAEHRAHGGGFLLCPFIAQLRKHNLYCMHSASKCGVSERDRLVAALAFAADIGEAEQPLRCRLELRFQHVPDTVLSAEAAVGDPEGDVRTDQAVVCHDVDRAKSRLLFIQSGEHPRDLIWDAPGQREVLGGREDVLDVIGAIGEQRTRCTTEEQCLSARVELADQRFKASDGRHEGALSHASSLERRKRAFGRFEPGSVAIASLTSSRPCAG